MNRKGFTRSLLVVPFTGLHVNLRLESLQPETPIPPQIKIYKNNNNDNGTLLGFKGCNFMETGMVKSSYMPYKFENEIR